MHTHSAYISPPCTHPFNSHTPENVLCIRLLFLPFPCSVIELVTVCQPRRPPGFSLTPSLCLHVILALLLFLYLYLQFFWNLSIVYHKTIKNLKDNKETPVTPAFKANLSYTKLTTETAAGSKFSISSQNAGWSLHSCKVDRESSSRTLKHKFVHVFYNMKPLDSIRHWTHVFFFHCASLEQKYC